MKRVTTMLAAAGALALLGAATPARADGWHHDRDWHGRAGHDHGWHRRPGWYGGYAAGPPVYYAPPAYYYPPPVYYAPPSVWFSAPGVSVGIN
ncbi:MAG TPA: hypothetical protein VFE41_13435 [Acetobacteraceae bacterium]|jgi:hypothetical protein|nr:hypothetical protein [Acetobacteraceae bacterium]